MKITDLRLQTKELDRQREFYADVLGLPAQLVSQGLLVQAGASRLIFTQNQVDLGGVYHVAFNIPQNRFDDAKVWLSRRLSLSRNNAGADSFAFENWNAHSLYFLDAAGNILELIARHGLSNDSDKPFTQRSILSISEIGLATDNVEATVRLLQTGLEVGVYDGEDSDMFTAVGDEEGLFIVVKEGRVWFPDTGQPARLLPVAISVINQANEARQVVGPPYRIIEQ